MSGGELFNTLLFENITSLDFEALKVTFHSAAHIEILSRSLFMGAAVIVGSLPTATKAPKRGPGVPLTYIFHDMMFFSEFLYHGNNFDI